jgi:Transposase DDE domain
MMERIFQAQFPVSWVVADTVYGGNLDLRNWLEPHQYSYVLAVAASEPVVYQTACGCRREEAALVEAFLAGQVQWQRLSMSEGTKGPRLFDWALVPMLHRGGKDAHHFLLIRRTIADPQEKRYDFVFAPQGTTLQEMVQAIGARWHIEEDFENAKDLGLDHYEVRSFIGWYRHITLVLVALAYLAGICATASGSPSPPASSESAPPARHPLLALSIPEARHLLARLIWPASRVRTPGAGLVVVASLSPKYCQLFPHQTSPEGWLILASSPCLSCGRCPSHLFPDIPEMSWKSGRSGTFPGSVVRLVRFFVLLGKES